jgi:dCTP deaminase
MILSNIEIHSALDRGWLSIAPEPSPRKPTPDGSRCPFQTSAVDLRLGNEIVWLKDGLPITIDLAEGNLASLMAATSENRCILDNEPFTLKPGMFVLGKTLERIKLPILADGPNLAARVEGRSSYARCGLLVHFTAPTIHAGFEGTITLEMMNFGKYPISLRKNSYICQLIIEEVKGTPFRNDSQFQGQSAPAGKLS